MTEHKPVMAGYGFAAITLLIWSSFVVVSRLGGNGVLTPFDVAALRIGTAAVVLSPWWLPRLLRPSLRKLRWHQSLILALLAGIGYPLSAYAGLHLAPASHGAVLISGMLPLFTSLLAAFFLGERPSLQRLLGMLLILTGGCTLLLASHAASAPGTGTGDLLLLCASILWSLFTALLKHWQVRAFDVTLGVTATSALIYLPVYAAFLPSHLHLASAGEIALQAFFQGFLVVCVAMWTYARAAEILGAVKVVIMMSTVPVTGTLLAVVFLHEPLTALAALGVAITSTGACLGAMARPVRPAQSR